MDVLVHLIQTYSYSEQIILSSFKRIPVKVLEEYFKPYFYNIYPNEYVPVTNSYKIEEVNEEYVNTLTPNGKIIVNNKIYDHPVIYILTITILNIQNENITKKLMYSVPFFITFDMIEPSIYLLDTNNYNLNIYSNNSEKIYHYMFSASSFKGKTILLTNKYILRIYKKYMLELFKI